MKFILINENDNNLIDLLELLLKLLTKSKDIVEYREILISTEGIKIIPILFSKLEKVCGSSYKILDFENTENPKDLIISLIIDIFKFLYSYDNLGIVDYEKQDNSEHISNNTIQNKKVISFKISIEKNLALNLSIINKLLNTDLDELAYKSIFNFCLVSVESKNNLDEVLFEILFQRMPFLNNNINKLFLQNLTTHCKADQYFLSRICDLSFFNLSFNLFMDTIVENSIYHFKLIIFI